MQIGKALVDFNNLQRLSSCAQWSIITSQLIHQHTHDFNIIYIVFAQLLLQVDRSMRRLLLSLLNLSCWTLKNYALVTFILKNISRGYLGGGAPMEYLVVYVTKPGLQPVSIPLASTSCMLRS